MIGIVTYNWAYYLAVVVGGVGLLFWASGLVLWWNERWLGIDWTLRGKREPRDRLIVGSALVLTALVIVALFGEVMGGDLFSDAASSVSTAPGP
jgi:hypothetical protein